MGRRGGPPGNREQIRTRSKPMGRSDKGERAKNTPREAEGDGLGCSHRGQREGIGSAGETLRRVREGRKGRLFERKARGKTEWDLGDSLLSLPVGQGGGFLERGGPETVRYRRKKRTEVGWGKIISPCSGILFNRTGGNNQEDAGRKR